MKSVEYKIFIKCRIPELGGQLKSEQYDSKTGIGWSVIPVFAHYYFSEIILLLGTFLGTHLNLIS